MQTASLPKPASHLNKNLILKILMMVSGVQLHMIKCNLQNKKIQLWKTQHSNGIPDIDANCIFTKTCKFPGQKLNFSNFNVGDW